MNTHTSTRAHANGHVPGGIMKAARKAKHNGAAGARKASGKLEELGARAKRQLQKVDVEQEVTRATRWVKDNPKTAVGAAIGIGLLVGALANGRFMRAAVIGLAGVIGKRFFR